MGFGVRLLVKRRYNTRMPSTHAHEWPTVNGTSSWELGRVLKIQKVDFGLPIWKVGVNFYLASSNVLVGDNLLKQELLTLLAKN
jgi:hypothetical protein